MDELRLNRQGVWYGILAALVFNRDIECTHVIFDHVCKLSSANDFMIGFNLSLPIMQPSRYRH